MKIHNLLLVMAAFLTLTPVARIAAQEKYPVKKEAVTKQDSRTGLKRPVLTDVTLQTKTTQKCDMMYSSVVSYSFLPARVAKALKAKEVGEVDFDKIKAAHTKKAAPDLLSITVPQPQLEEHFIDNPEHIRVIYGMNKTNQRKFKVVRIEKVNLGAGPDFGPVEALVSNDENSDFGIIGSDWLVKAYNKKTNQGFLYSAYDLLYYSIPPAVKGR